MKKILITICLLFTLLPANAASWQISQARQEYAAGKYSQALKTIDTAIKSSTYKNAEAYKLKGQILLKMNSPVSANKAFDEAIKIEPSGSIYQLKGNTALQLKDYAGAAECFAKSAEYRDCDPKELLKSIQKMVNDKDTPMTIKWVIYNGSLSQAALAAGHSKIIFESKIPFFRALRMIYEGDANDPFYKEVKNGTKEEVIANIRKEYEGSEDPQASSGKYGNFIREMTSGYVEYCFNNKEMGKKIIYGTLEEFDRKVTTLEAKKASDILHNEIQATLNGIDSPTYDVLQHTK